MSKTKNTNARQPDRSPLRPPAASRQIAFHQLLVAARNEWYIDALSSALGSIDQNEIKRQVTRFVPLEAQQTLAKAGLRDEHVFPLPAVLDAKPSLVGYYRMLLGASQKAFYEGRTGLGAFKSMEISGALNLRQKATLADFCAAMAIPLSDIVTQIPALTERDLRELPLLTFGSQLQGSHNTQIGKKAMEEVFLAIAEVVKGHITERLPKRLVVVNASRRKVFISLASDPDVSIQEFVGKRVHSKVAIEVKGGTDYSNAHNRAGEAEKSHLKAKKKGFKDFWTIISKQRMEMFKLIQESQTTTEWFDVTELLARNGKDWEEFRARLADAVGIPLE